MKVAYEIFLYALLLGLIIWGVDLNREHQKKFNGSTILKFDSPDTGFIPVKEYDSFQKKVSVDSLRR